MFVPNAAAMLAPRWRKRGVGAACTEQRAKWSVLARFEGEIDILDGHTDEAITHLQRALDLGDTDASTARQIAQLLISRGRGDEARTYMAIANAKGSGSDASSSEMLEIGALADKDMPKAVKLLEHARERDPNDPQKMVSLGQLLPELGREEEAEKLLRGLVEKHPDLPLGWFELIRLLKTEAARRRGAAGRAGRATETTQGADRSGHGTMLRVVGRHADGREFFLKARDAKPNDLGLARALATFYARKKDGAKAREQLDLIVKAKPTNDADREHIAWANRELSVMIAAERNLPGISASDGTAKPKDSKWRVSLADKVAMARLLSDRPEADSRMEATAALRGDQEPDEICR